MRSDTRRPYHDVNEIKIPVRPAVEEHPYDPDLEGHEADTLNRTVNLELEVQTQEILKTFERSGLLPETRALILASTILAEYLEDFDAYTTPAEYEAVIRQTAREIVAEKRQQLERAGLRFNNEGTLILDQNGREAMAHHPKLRAELQQLSQLIEAQHARFSPTKAEGFVGDTKTEGFVGDTNVEREWLGEPRRQETEQEQKQLMVLEELHSLPIPPELKMSILNHPSMAYNLARTDLTDLPHNAAELLRNVAQEMSSDERAELLEAGVNVDNEGTLIFEGDQPPALSPAAAEHLRLFQNLLEVVHFKKVIPKKLIKLETLGTPVEQLAKILPAQLKRLGLSDHAINAAYDLGVINEFISEGHLKTTIPDFREAAAKALRHVENKAGFTVDEMAEPVVIGVVENLKNFFTFGRTAQKLKSRPEYSQMLALNALLEDLGGMRDTAPVKYPTVEQFAEPTPVARPPRGIDRAAMRWAVAGAGGLISAAAVKEFSDNLHQSVAQVRPVETQARETLTEVPDTTPANAPKITIAPRAEEPVAKQRARRAPAEQIISATAPITQSGFNETAAVSSIPEPALKKAVEVKEPKAKRVVKAEKTRKVSRAPQKNTRSTQKTTVATSPTANEILQETLQQISPRRKSPNPKISQN